MSGAGNPATRRHIKRMRRDPIVIALMALLGASLYYAYGIWTHWARPTCRADDAAMIVGVLFSIWSAAA